MSALYLFLIMLSLFAGMLPAGILSVIWESISENMTVDIPYIALLRLLLALGAIIAVILTDRIRKLLPQRDLLIGSVALESVMLIGFSLSRVFWHLAMWTFCLGFTIGLCFTLNCSMLMQVADRILMAAFAASACAAGLGVYLMSTFLELGNSWRHAVQGLAIIMITLCMVLFFLRRVRPVQISDRMAALRRENTIRRQRNKEQLIRAKGEVDERAQGAFLIRFLSGYAAAVCSGFLLLCACLLPPCLEVLDGKSGGIWQSIALVCAGMAAGRIFLMLTGAGGRLSMLIGTVILGAALTVCAVLLHLGNAQDTALLLIRVGTGAGAGMILPALLISHDERVDEEAEHSMAILACAFYLGTDALITPFVQALVGTSKTGSMALWMLGITAVMGLCLLAASSRVRQ